MKKVDKIEKLKRLKFVLYIYLLLPTIIISCDNPNNRTNKELKGDLENSKKNQFVTLDDLIRFSKAKYGFVKKDGSINIYYGDFTCTSPEKKIFDFTVGCGSLGDIISIIIKKEISKTNSFNLFIPSGEVYFGKINKTEKKIGEFIVSSENEIHGSIKLCLDESSGCCGEEGETFTLKLLRSNDKLYEINNKKTSFTIKRIKDLSPNWLNSIQRSYMLNDERITEPSEVAYIGGCFSKNGEIFFINDSEVVFSKNQEEIFKEKTIITKILKSGKYKIKISWDTSLTTGAYSEGSIVLYENNKTVHESKLIISGW